MEIGEPITRPERMCRASATATRISCCSAKVKQPQVTRPRAALPSHSLRPQVSGMRIWFARLLCLLILLPAAIAATAQERIVADRVFHVPDPKSNVIQFQMIVMAGSADETNPAQLGIAHYLEHLVLVGRNEGFGEASVKFFADGNANGWTNSRATGYIHSFPAGVRDAPERLDRLFQFYAGRLTDFSISPEDAIRERNVVRQEHDWRYASSPTSGTWMEVSRFLYEGHAFADWTIGRPETIAAFTVDEARTFLRRWYRKANVWFIVTGPVSSEVVAAAATSIWPRSMARRRRRGPGWKRGSIRSPCRGRSARRTGASRRPRSRSTGWSARRKSTAFAARRRWRSSPASSAAS